jgi:hypothetical protein
MSFDNDFLEHMPQSISVEVFSAFSTDGYAVGTHGTAKTFRARIEQDRRLVKDSAGREVVSNTTIFCPPWSTAGTSDTASIEPNDVITLPSGFTGTSQPPIINVLRHDDEDGIHHQEILL